VYALLYFKQFCSEFSTFLELGFGFQARYLFKGHLEFF